MGSINNILTASFFFNSAVSLFMAILVIYLRSRSAVVRALFLISISVAIWMFSMGMLTISISASEAMVWSKIQHAAILIAVTFLLNFALVFVKDTREKRLGAWFFYIINAAISFFVISGNLVVVGVKSHQFSKFTVVWGPLFWLYLVALYFTVLFSVLILFISYRNETSIKRTQSRYLFLSVFFAALASSSILTVTFDMNIFPFGIPFYSISQIILLYAILTTRLMDLEIVVKKSLFYSMITALITGLYLLLLFISNRFLRGFFGINSIYAIFPIAIVISLILQPFLSRIQKKVDYYFFRRKYNYEKMLEDATVFMTRLVDLKKVLKLITRNISRQLQLSSVILFFFEEEKNSFCVRAADRDGKKYANECIMLNNPLVQRFKFEGEIIVKDEIEYELMQAEHNEIERKNLKEILNEINRLEGKVCVPGVARDKILGFIVLGKKLSGDAFTKEELDLLTVLADQVALAVENSIFFEQQKKLVRKVSEMEAKAEYARMVEKANKQLTKVNEELVKAQDDLVKTERLASLTKLAVGLNQEIGNPLTTIMANIQIVMKEIKDGETPSSEFLVNMLGPAEEQAIRIREIIHGLQSISGPVISSLMPEIQSINLSQSICEPPK